MLNDSKTAVTQILLGLVVVFALFGLSNGERVVDVGESVHLPFAWSDMGKKMVDAGVIDGERFLALYEANGGLTPAGEQLLFGDNNPPLVADKENARFVLNLLWPLGLGNANTILESDRMRDPRYGDGAYFASTGGWTLSRGNPMDHYGAHNFVSLSKSQEELVERVASSVYRPCCDNPVSLPDCNHGMAMLGLLELLAANGSDENDMYEYALSMNRLWFPGQYGVIEEHVGTTDARELVDYTYSSLSGYSELVDRYGASATGVGCAV